MKMSKVAASKWFIGSVGMACIMGCFAFLAGFAAAGPSAPADKHADITPMCGTKPMVIGLVDGYGGDIWRKLVLAQLKDEVSKCPNVKDVLYADAGGDRQKWETDVNSMVAQGVNILICFTDFGDSMIPGLRKAYKAGVTVIPYIGRLSGTAGKDYTANVVMDSFEMGKIEGEWLGKQVKKGNVIYLSGEAGHAVATTNFNGFKAGISKYPGVKVLEDNYIATDWNPAQAQKAVVGLIAKYGGKNINGVGSDFGILTLSAIQVFERAGLPVPPQVTMSIYNELNGKYLSDKKAGKEWPLMGVTNTNIIRFAVRRGVAEYQGTPNKESLSLIPYPVMDSTKGLYLKYDPAAPPDADFSALLPKDKLYEVLKMR